MVVGGRSPGTGSWFRSVSFSKWMLTSPPSPLAQSALALSPRQSSTWPDSDARSSGKPRMLGENKHLHLLSPYVLTVTFSLGQDPPPQQQEDAFDGRSLAEVCVSHISSLFR